MSRGLTRSLVQQSTSRRWQLGTTILEVLVAFSLFGVVTLTAFAVFSTSFKGMLAGRGFADEHQNTRLVLEWMTRRLRLAGLGVSPSEVFTEGTATSVAFQYDSDRDGTAEVHRFCWDSSEGAIREEVGSISTGCGPSSGAPVSSRGLRPVKVVLADFRYFRGDEVELARPLNAATLPQVKRLRIILGADSNRTSTYEVSQDFTITMDTVLRNQ